MGDFPLWALVALLAASLVFTWAPVVVEFVDEFRNYPPPHARRRQRQARRTAGANRSRVDGSNPEIGAMRWHSSIPSRN